MRLGQWRLALCLAICIHGSAGAQEARSQPFRLLEPFQKPAGDISSTPQCERHYRNLVELYERLNKDGSGQVDEPSLVQRRVDLLNQIVRASPDWRARSHWISKLAEALKTTTIANNSPASLGRLVELARDTRRLCDRETAAYVDYCALQARFSLELARTDINLESFRSRQVEQLRRFVSEYPMCHVTAEATLELAICHELTHNTAEAQASYETVCQRFPGSQQVAQSAGALSRLASINTRMQLKGTTIDGQRFDLSDFRGRCVLVHYWASWAADSKHDMETLSKCAAQFDARKLAIIGVNLDANRDEAVLFLADNAVPWRHLFESGGMASRLAIEFGIIKVPMIVLVDQQGLVVDTALPASDVLSKTEGLLR